MLSELPPTSAILSTSAWLFLTGMLTYLLVIGQQLPFAPTQKPAQRVAALPASQVGAPSLNWQYAATSAVATPSAAL